VSWRSPDRRRFSKTLLIKLNLIKNIQGRPMKKNIEKGLKKRDRHGAAAVEFAAVLPLLMILVLGCIDVGRFSYNYMSMTNATSEAATFASLNNPGKFGGMEQWVTAVKQRAITESSTLDPPLVAADVVVDTSVLEAGLVSVQVNHAFTTLIDWPGLPHVMPMGRRIILSQTP
jgi:Flp pilus assembly protein TadG